MLGVAATSCSAASKAPGGWRWPPFTLRGRADPLVAGAELGGWRVEVVAR